MKGEGKAGKGEKKEEKKKGERHQKRDRRQEEAGQGGKGGRKEGKFKTLSKAPWVLVCYHCDSNRIFQHIVELFLLFYEAMPVLCCCHQYYFLELGD